MFYIFVLFSLFTFTFSAPIEGDEQNVQCGVSKALDRYNAILNNGNRIMGGVVSPPMYWPWVVALIDSSGQECTGEIIGKRWILTAAHCVDEVARGFFVAGTNNVRRQNEKTKYEINQYYLPPNNESDILLVELSRDLEYSRSISPICLSRTFEPSEGDRAVVAGFGLLFIEYDSDQGTGVDGEDTNLLHEGIVTIKNVTECEIYLNDTVDGAICAGGINRGVMSGDSGGPIMGIKDNKFYLFGTVQGGRAFEAEEGDPLTVNEFDTYTTVSLHCDWIEEMTKGDVKCEN